MEISDVRVRLVKDGNERLKAVCTITFDGEFVVRDVKVVEGTHGLFVAMPSRKLSSPCPRCKAQNYIRAKHCNECGAKLAPLRIPADSLGREKAHRDVAHPITTAFRQTLQERVLEAYRLECEEAQHAEYASPEVGDDFDFEDGAVAEYGSVTTDPNGRAEKTPAQEDRSTGGPHGDAVVRREGRIRRRGRRGNRREARPRGVDGSREAGREPQPGWGEADRQASRQWDGATRPSTESGESQSQPQPMGERTAQPSIREEATSEEDQRRSAPSGGPSRPAPPAAEEEDTAFGAGIL